MIPPQRTTLPLWLAILLKRQRRANIMPPPWLLVENIADVLETETHRDFTESFSPAPSIPIARQTDYNGKAFYTAPPFVESCTATALANSLPYHWFEVSEILLEAASDDIPEPDKARQLLRDIREVRLAKMRKQVDHLSGDGEGTRLDGRGCHGSFRVQRIHGRSGGWFGEARCQQRTGATGTRRRRTRKSKIQ